jgi:hypothetical protein
LPRRQRNEPIALAAEEWIGADDERVHSLLGQDWEGRVQIVFAVCTEHFELLSDRARHLLRGFRLGLGIGFLGLMRRPITAALGTSSRISSRRFGPSASVSDRVRATLGQTCTQRHCARFQSAWDRTCLRYAKIVQLYQSRTNRSSAAAKAFLSLHFLFQDLTQYQERYWPNTDPNSQPLCVGFLQSRS